MGDAAVVVAVVVLFVASVFRRLLDVGREDLLGVRQWARQRAVFIRQLLQTNDSDPVETLLPGYAPARSPAAWLRTR